MKQVLILTVLFLSGCSDSNEVKDKIRGKWYFDNSDTYIKITRNEYIVKNDSPVPEDYKLIGDSLLVKGFEASTFPWKYADTLKIIRLTQDTLILMNAESTLLLHKK